MQFSIKPVNLHHYDVFMVNPIKEKLFGKTSGENYMGSICISLDGNNMDLHCEDSRMKDYAEVLSKQAYTYYANGISNNIS